MCGEGLDCGPMIMSSDLFQFGCRLFACIPDLNQAGGEGEWRVEVTLSVEM